MVRATILAILFSTAVLANNIYVEQAHDTQDQDKILAEKVASIADREKTLDERETEVFKFNHISLSI